MGNRPRELADDPTRESSERTFNLTRCSGCPTLVTCAACVAAGCLTSTAAAFCVAAVCAAAVCVAAACLTSIAAAVCVAAACLASIAAEVVRAMAAGFGATPATTITAVSVRARNRTRERFGVRAASDLSGISTPRLGGEAGAWIAVECARRGILVGILVGIGTQCRSLARARG